MLLVLLLQALGAVAVKDYLFKDCTQSGFCARNRHYAAHVTPQAAPYSLALDSVSIAADAITGHITKTLPQSSIELPFSLSILDGDNVRFTMDEDRSNVQVPGLESARFSGAAEAAIQGLAQKRKPIDANSVSRSESSLVYSFGRFSVIIQAQPLTLTVQKDGEVEMVINSKALLNLEHHRLQGENDAHLQPFESDFDMFHDSFPDNKNDRIPFGPESVAVDIVLPGYTHAYGLAEHADSFALRDTIDTPWPYRLYNVDIFEYETDSRMPMYGSIPLLTATKPGSSVGIFWVNSADTFVDIETGSSVSTHWMSENGILDLVLILGDSPSEVTSKYGGLTGFVTLPPEFALGYHQCRWNYNDEDDVLDITEKMDLHRIPYDTIWLDVEYPDQKKFFTWNSATFPNPERMLQKLDSTGRNLVVLIDPHFKTDYFVSNTVSEKNISINDAKNETYKGHCWPGESVWIDSLNPNAQPYWDMLFELSSNGFFSSQTNIHLWNDMNEPSFFNGPETSSPRDNRHYGGLEHRSIHNLWGKSFHELTYTSLIKRLQESTRQRPFILTRSYFAGSQRTAAMWTGDNMARWEYLEQSVPMVLTSNVVGMPFAGADVGGFFGDPSKELLTRWYQTGIWYPFFRAHAHIDSRRREPWVAGEPYTSIMRDAVLLRYALLPTIYTAFYDASTEGTPVWKPMLFDEPSNPETYTIQNQFFVGNSGIMVHPVTQQDASAVSVYIPSNEVFYDYTNGNLGKKVASGKLSRRVTLEDIPMFVKGGSIFARRDRYRRSSRLMRNDPFSLVIALGDGGAAEGHLYLDDGESFGYKMGEFSVEKFTASKNHVHGESSGNYSISKMLAIEKITIAGVPHKVTSISVTQNGKSWSAQFTQTDDLVEIQNPKVVLGKVWDIEIKDLSHDEL